MLSTQILQQVNSIKKNIETYTRKRKSIFVSSSFQTHSIPLLHIIVSIDKSIPVYFLNTGFHFPETLTFRDEVASFLDLTVISVESNISKVNQRDHNGRFFFCSNSDYCCHINKISPLEPALIKHDVWITGVRRDQNSNRQNMNFEAKGPFNTTRFHPMLDWTSKMIWQYRKAYSLPSHPLEQEGYLSIGCTPCTKKYTDSTRGGRWAGQNKSECGLHTELISR